MIDALYIGATGLAAQQSMVDTISNNIANLNTSGYKKSKISFEDMVYRTSSPRQLISSTESSENRQGTGVSIAGINKVFSIGDLKQTDNALDIAIKGQGFLEVITPDGNSAFTRAGTLEITKDGLLAGPGGFPLRQSIRIPSDATNLNIDGNGVISATVPNEKAPLEVGQIDLSMFSNPASLNPIGNNLYVATDRSGDPLISKPGENGSGTLAQGYLESSNVNLVEELTNLLLAQRAYGVNAKVIQAADDLMQMSNNLRR